jgi:hypothetical protein
MRDVEVKFMTGPQYSSGLVGVVNFRHDVLIDGRYCEVAWVGPAVATFLPQSLGAGRPANRSIIQATAASALSLATKP